MSVRRKYTERRLTLIRACGTCGRVFTTTADTPFVRQVPRDGKQQVITYFCSESCKRASYKHLFDGRVKERKREWDANRDVSAKNRKYYAAHREQEKARARARYLADPESARADVRYQRKKRAAKAREETQA